VRRLLLPIGENWPWGKLFEALRALDPGGMQTQSSPLDTNIKLRARWDALELANHQVNQEVFRSFYQRGGYARKVLNCSITPARANALVQFQMPPGWDLDKSLRGSVRLDPGLERWHYEPRIKPQLHLPYFKEIPAVYARLATSPWAQYGAPSDGIPLNARLLRYQHPLWQELKPKKLRGVFTTLVYVTPQIGYSLTPHINLDNAFHYFSSLARAAGPCQMLPAAYLYPDARMPGLGADCPAAIFADLMPHLGGDATPLLEGMPNCWGEISRFDVRGYYYGYPFQSSDPQADRQENRPAGVEGGTVLPDGKRGHPTSVESQILATLDPHLKEDLLLDGLAFQDRHCLRRGIVTHDGIPFQLPPEMQACVFAITVTAWEMDLAKPGDLSEYTLKTRHAAIRSYHFYQQIEPYYTHFMRLIRGLAQDPTFKVYQLSNHLNSSWIGGNTRLSNQLSYFEKWSGPKFVREYNHQQLDWMMGVINLWNQVDFRRGTCQERLLPFDGLAFHQMASGQLHFASHLFVRPIKSLSPWPGLHPEWVRHDRVLSNLNLPVP
jgi:hypothetical protein